MTGEYHEICEHCDFFDIKMKWCQKHKNLKAARAWRYQLDKCKKDGHVYNNRLFTRKEIRSFSK